MLNKLSWQAWLIYPYILGITASILPGMGAIAATPKPDLMSLETTSVDSNITPLQIFDFDISQTTISPNPEDITTESDTQTEDTTTESDTQTEDITTESDTQTEDTTTKSDTQTEDTTTESDTQTEDTTTESDTQTEDTTTESDTQTEDTTASDSNRWHFLFQPYLYLPITIYGDTNIGKVDGDIDIDFDQIKTTIDEDLNFAFMGNFQAWTPNYHLGMFANIDYLSLSTDATFNRPVRYSKLEDYIPTELEANTDVNTWSVDLAASYRFYNESQVNPKGVKTEFDLGRLVFDVYGGLNITAVNLDTNLSTNLGGEASFDSGTTIVSPLVGGRLRFNVTRNLALVILGSFHGFGISGLTSWGALGGIDWMFAGDTSLGIGYRFGNITYNNDLDRGQDFGVNLTQNGPYLSFSFRF